MPNRILFCATVDYHFSAFHLPILEWFKQRNWEVHVAASGDMELPFVDQKFNLPIARSPFRRSNIDAYRQLQKIIEENDYQIIHSHTPMGGVLSRLAARKARRRGTRVLYTAHGFHFCKGAPMLNWLLYYPIERMLAHVTDCLITINQEDFSRAVSHKFKAGRIQRIHGVGVNPDRYKPLSDEEWLHLRTEAGYQPHELLLFYAAEFNKNKNHQLLLRAFAASRDYLPNARLVLAGTGVLMERCMELAASLGIANRVDFLGYRKDIDRLVPMCDIAVASSLREGLPVNMMEAMACGLPIIATRNRGHNELVGHEQNGFLLAPHDVEGFSEALKLLGSNQELRFRMGGESLKRVQQYSLTHVKQQLSGIYTSHMPKKEWERLEWLAQ